MTAEDTKERWANSLPGRVKVPLFRHGERSWFGRTMALLVARRMEGVGSGAAECAGNVGVGWHDQRRELGHRPVEESC